MDYNGLGQEAKIRNTWGYLLKGYGQGRTCRKSGTEDWN